MSDNSLTKTQLAQGQLGLCFTFELDFCLFFICYYPVFFTIAYCIQTHYLIFCNYDKSDEYYILEILIIV